MSTDLETAREYAWRTFPNDALRILEAAGGAEHQVPSAALSGTDLVGSHGSQPAAQLF